MNIKSKTIILTALVLLLSLLPAFSVLAETAPLVVMPHSVTFVGVEEVPGVGWKWIYDVQSGAGTAISHIEWELCVPEEALVSVSDTIYDWKFQGTDLLKFETGWSDYELRRVWFILDEYYAQDTINFNIKDGDGYENTTTIGPVCDPDLSGEIGDFVWYDFDGNGDFDAGIDYGINGVTIDLYHDQNGNGIPEASEYVGSTTTGAGPSTEPGGAAADGQGYYSFTGLMVDPDGELYITVVADSNFVSGGSLHTYAQTYDNDGPLDNTSKSVALTSGGTSSDLSLDFAYRFEPEAVELASFSATPGEGSVLIAWETGSEINNLGFNIYRGTEDQIESATMINDQLIPSKAFGSVSGATYEYLDTDVEPGVFYHYWLEDVESVSNPQAAALLMGIHYVGQARGYNPLNTKVISGLDDIGGGKLR